MFIIDNQGLDKMDLNIIFLGTIIILIIMCNMAPWIIMWLLISHLLLYYPIILSSRYSIVPLFYHPIILSVSSITKL